MDGPGGALLKRDPFASAEAGVAGDQACCPGALLLAEGVRAGGQLHGKLERVSVLIQRPAMALAH